MTVNGPQPNNVGLQEDYMALTIHDGLNDATEATIYRSICEYGENFNKYEPFVQLIKAKIQYDIL